MNGKDIFLGLKYVGDDLVEEAEFGKFPKKAAKTTYKRSLLAAALIAMMLMLVGCGIAYAHGWFARFFVQRSKEPLSQSAVEYIDKIEQPIHETMAHTQAAQPTGAVIQDGYTLTVKSTMTDGNMAYITIGITGPKDAVLNKTVIPGYSSLAPAICAENFMEPGFFEPVGGGVRLGYTSMGAVEDNDGLDYTQDLLLTIEAEMEDGTPPFAADQVWKLHIENLVATYHDLEAQKALDAQYGGGEHLSFTEEDGINPYPEVILAEGSWDYELSFADGCIPTVELIREPVTANICIGGRFDGDPDTYQDVKITSFALSSLSATVVMDTDGFPELQDYKNQKFVCAVMKDGSQVELFTRSSDGPGKLKLEAVCPIDLDQVDYVLLADGTRLPMP